MSIDLRNMERLKRIFAFFGLAGVLLLAACSKQAGDAPGPETGTEPAIRWEPASPTVDQLVSFSLDGDVSSLTPRPESMSSRRSSRRSPGR